MREASKARIKRNPDILKAQKRPATERVGEGKQPVEVRGNTALCGMVRLVRAKPENSHLIA